MCFAPYPLWGALRAAHVLREGQLDLSGIGKLGSRAAPRTTFDAIEAGAEIALSGMRPRGETLAFAAPPSPVAVELTVGFANRIVHTPPDGVTVAVTDPTTIIVTGADKQKVGQFAAEIRASKKPEPYKGKGVRYENEVVRRKEGKSFAAGK